MMDGGMAELLKLAQAHTAAQGRVIGRVLGLEAENARLKAALAQAKVYLRAFIPNPKPSDEYRIRGACERLDQIASGMDDKS